MRTQLIVAAALALSVSRGAAQTTRSVPAQVLEDRIAPMAAAIEAIQANSRTPKENTRLVLPTFRGAVGAEARKLQDRLARKVGLATVDPAEAKLCNVDSARRPCWFNSASRVLEVSDSPVIGDSTRIEVRVHTALGAGRSGTVTQQVNLRHRGGRWFASVAPGFSAGNFNTEPIKRDSTQRRPPPI